MRTEDGNIVVIDVKKGFEVYETDSNGLEMFLGKVPFDRVDKIRDTLVRRAVTKHETALAKARRLHTATIRVAQAEVVAVRKLVRDAARKLARDA